jgi:hypothetical protein
MSDEFTDSTSQVESPKARVGAKAPIGRIRRQLQKQLDEAYLKLSSKGKPFTHEEQNAVVENVLSEVDLNQYRKDIAHRIATADRQQRHKSFGRAMAFMAMGQFDFFSREQALRVWIPTDEGNDVALAFAKWTDLQHKIVEQESALAAVTETLKLTRDNWAVVEPYMKDDPQCDFTQAIQKLGHWLND